MPQPHPRDYGQNWLTSDFDFDLPAKHIAQAAIEPRDQARLLHVLSEGMEDRRICDLPDMLRAGDLLVMNNTKVIPARIHGMRGAVSIEVMLHKIQSPTEWLAFAKPGKRLKVGDTIIFSVDFEAEVLEKRDGGEVLLRFNVSQDRLYCLLETYGEPPLPPYIQRGQGEAVKDRARYQTVYATREGAVAAPTAGLHFTSELLERLEAKGVEKTAVTLHVGAGTFLPVKADAIRDHVMHAEWGEITSPVAEQINRAKQQGRRIISVGTTSLRLLESSADEAGSLQPFSAETDIFIAPGYRFRVVDVLLTNFHLPKSTLFMLVSAFAGVERMRKAYEHAIRQDYRFYSYGDASLLEKA